MSKRLYVGNLPFTVSQEEVKAEFAKYGTIEDCHLPMDRESGRPRGFGFVTFADNTEADAAIAALNGANFGGRSLRVNEAEDRRAGGGGGGGSRPQGGGGGGGGRSFQGGGGGGRGGGGGGGSRGRRHSGGDRYED